MGLFDAISGIFRSAGAAVTDFAGGAFSAVDERLRGGTLRTTSQAAVGTRLGAAVGNLFGDIAENYIKAVDYRLPGTFPGPLPPMTQGATKASGAPTAVATQAGPTQASLLPYALSLPQVLDPLSRAVTAGVGAYEAQTGFDVPLLGPGSYTAPPEFQGPAIEPTTGVYTGEGMNGGAVALPGGAAVTPALSLPMGGAIFRPSMDLVTGRVRANPQRVVMIPNPVTGAPTFFGHLGRPILFSRDLSVVKRVNRLASRARRVRGRR